MTTGEIKRIIGIETEYGITCARNDGKVSQVSVDEAAQMLFTDIMDNYRSTSAFLPNGGRLYLDVGAHPEYASAECDNALDALIQDQSGTVLLRQICEEVNAKLACGDYGAKLTKERIHLFKNNLDSVGNSCGCHENYSLRRSKNYRSLIESLVPFLVTRQLITGNGWVYQEAGKIGFGLSQRAYQIDDAISGATTRSRPLVNTRDEPHSDPEKFRRLHVISGDSNIAPAPTLFKLGATNLLLNSLETGLDIQDFNLENPIQALRQSTFDLFGSNQIKLSNGKTITAIEILEGLRERLDYHLKQQELNDVDRKVLQIWDECLVYLKHKDSYSLRNLLDWCAKYHILETYRSKHDLQWDDIKISRLDLAYHDIGPAGLNLLSRGMYREYSTAQQVEKATLLPPENTRAVLRAKFITKAREKRIDVSADWTHLRINDAKLATVIINDPFETSNSQVDELMQWMEEG